MFTTRYFIRICDQGDRGLQANQTVEAVDEGSCYALARFFEREFGGAVAFSVVTNRDGSETLKMLKRFGHDHVPDLCTKNLAALPLHQ